MGSWQQSRREAGNGGGARLDAEFFQSVFHLLLNRADPQAENPRDVEVGFALGDPGQDFSLARREAGALEMRGVKVARFVVQEQQGLIQAWNPPHDEAGGFGAREGGQRAEQRQHSCARPRPGAVGLLYGRDGRERPAAARAKDCYCVACDLRSVSSI